MRWLLLLCLTITLAACSGLGLVKNIASTVLGPDDGLEVEVDANAGQADAEGDDSLAQNANTAVSLAGGSTEENFEGPVGQVINEAGLEIHELLLLVLLAGWFIPSPSEMLAGMIRGARELWLTASGKQDNAN